MDVICRSEHRPSFQRELLLHLDSGCCVVFIFCSVPHPHSPGLYQRTQRCPQERVLQTREWVKDSQAGSEGGSRGRSSGLESPLVLNWVGEGGEGGATIPERKFTPEARWVRKEPRRPLWSVKQKHEAGVRCFSARARVCEPESLRQTF